MTWREKKNFTPSLAAIKKIRKANCFQIFEFYFRDYFVFLSFSISPSVERLLRLPNDPRDILNFQTIKEDLIFTQWTVTPSRSNS